MGHQQHGTSTGMSTQPLTTLPYRDAPMGPVVVSDAALEAFRKTRPWAMLFAVLLFMYAAAGGAVGVVWLVLLLRRLVAGPPPRPPYINPWSINLLFAPLAAVGGGLAVSYFRAAGNAYWRRNGDDLERASIRLKRLWLCAGAAVILMIALALCVIFIAMFVTHDWPG